MLPVKNATCQIVLPEFYSWGFFYVHTYPYPKPTRLHLPLP